MRSAIFAAAAIATVATALLRANFCHMSRFSRFYFVFVHLM